MAQITLRITTTHDIVVDAPDFDTAYDAVTVNRPSVIGDDIEVLLVDCMAFDVEDIT